MKEGTRGPAKLDLRRPRLRVGLADGDGDPGPRREHLRQTRERARVLPLLVEVPLLSEGKEACLLFDPCAHLGRELGGRSTPLRRCVDGRRACRSVERGRGRCCGRDPTRGGTDLFGAAYRAPIQWSRIDPKPLDEARDRSTSRWIVPHLEEAPDRLHRADRGRGRNGPHHGGIRRGGAEDGDPIGERVPHLTTRAGLSPDRGRQ